MLKKKKKGEEEEEEVIKKNKKETDKLKIVTPTLSKCKTFLMKTCHITRDILNYVYVVAIKGGYICNCKSDFFPCKSDRTMYIIIVNKTKLKKKLRRRGRNKK